MITIRHTGYWSTRCTASRPACTDHTGNQYRPISGANSHTGAYLCIVWDRSLGSRKCARSIGSELRPSVSGFIKNPFRAAATLPI